MEQSNNIIDAMTSIIKENQELKKEVARLKSQLPEKEQELMKAKDHKDIPLREIAQPLVVKLNDTTIHNCFTFRTVYVHMDVDWKTEVTTYMRQKHSVRVPTKYTIVDENPKLKTEFARIVNILLAE